MEKTNEEILSKYKKVFYEDLPQSTGSAIEYDDCLEAMSESVTQDRKRIEGIIDEEIKHLNSQTVTVGKIRQRVYDSRVKWLKELKQKIGNVSKL